MISKGRVITVLSLWAAALVFVLGTNAFHSFDFKVYLAASDTWRNGGDIYNLAPMPTALGPQQLPFVYPPIAAVLFTPLAVLPQSLAIVLWYVVALAALTGVVYLFAGMIQQRHPQFDARWITACIVPFCLLIGPVREELTFGQINLILMALVAVDLLTPNPRWPRGALIGVAAAVKVLPGIFILFLLLRRDFRAVLVSGAAFLGATLCGFAIAPQRSIDYWTDVLYETGRRTTDIVGGLWWSPNQSVTGALERLHWVNVDTAIIVAVSVVVVAVGLLAMRNALRLPHFGAAVALLVNATIGLLIVPTSWTYHWVWIVPALMILAVYALELRSLFLAAIGAFVAAVFVAAAPWAMQRYDGSELKWNVVQYLAADAYPLIAIAALVALAAMRPASVVEPDRAQRGAEWVPETHELARTG
jgi:alpha-1,2-mannosyltransferase